MVSGRPLYGTLILSVTIAFRNAETSNTIAEFAIMVVVVSMVVLLSCVSVTSTSTGFIANP